MQLKSGLEKTGFRYDINALRAIAIIGVLLYHYKVSFLEGGFVGVDVFFVISGYLMSKIIQTSIEGNRFSISDYYSRRVKRIVPALLCLIFLLSILCFFLYFPEDYKLNERNAAASALFVSNIYYWKSSNYFAASSETNLFLHTWSLSVEWQFYLFYPFLFLVLNRFIKKNTTFLYLFIALTALLCVASIISTRLNPTASFYLLPTRSWEMFAGGTAFFFERSAKNLKFRPYLAIFGYLVLLLCFFLLDTSMPWPGIATIFPVTATFLIIIASCNHFQFVRSDMLQFLGKISYSVYLWHWPVYVIAQYYAIGVTSAMVLVYTTISVLLGYLSFTYIETIKFQSSKSVLWMTLSCFLLTATLGYLNFNDIIYQPKTLAVANYTTAHISSRKAQYRLDTCHITEYKDFKHENCLCIDERRRNFLILGDSHMGQLAQSFNQKAASINVNIIQATASATFTRLSKQRPKKQKADGFYFSRVYSAKFREN
jgi:peptidoglycan/LPS O-acetylase OafA/YrhL